MKRGDRPFVVGRSTRRATTVVLLDEADAPAEKPTSPIRGPWTLRAVVTPSPAR